MAVLSVRLSVTFVDCVKRLSVILYNQTSFHILVARLTLVFSYQTPWQFDRSFQKTALNTGGVWKSSRCLTNIWLYLNDEKYANSYYGTVTETHIIMIYRTGRRWPCATFISHVGYCKPLRSQCLFYKKIQHRPIGHVRNKSRQLKVMCDEIYRYCRTFELILLYKVIRSHSSNVDWHHCWRPSRS